MNLSSIIQMADELYANTYSDELKLQWCYEVSASILEKIKKQFGESEYSFAGDNAEYSLPDDVSFDDVEYVFLDGKQFTKTDARSFCTADNKIRAPIQFDTMKIVYQKRLLPYEIEDIETLQPICSPSYEKLYLYYILAQIGYFQNDYEEYNKHTLSFNSLWDEYANSYAAKSPIDLNRRVKKIY